MTDLHGSESQAELDNSDSRNDEEATCEASMIDDFFTPLPSPHNSSHFRRAINTHLEVLGSFLIAQYEKDMSFLKDENQRLCHCLLALQKAAGTTVTPAQTPLYLEPYRLGHAGVQEDCDLSLAGLQNSGFATPLECLETAPSSPRHSPRSLDPAVVSVGMLEEDAIYSSTLPESSVVPAKSVNSAHADEFREHMCKSGDCTDDRTPLLETELADDARSKLLESARFSSLPALEATVLSGSEKAQVDEGVPLDNDPDIDLEITLSGEQSSCLLPKKHKKKKMKKMLRHGLTRQLYAPDSERTFLSKSGFHSSHILERDMTRLQRFVESSKFDLISGGFIMANALVFAVKLQYDGFDCGHAIIPGVKTAKETWPGADNFFLILKYLFTAVFIVELLLRLAVSNFRTCVRSGWIWFDVMIVLLGLVDTFAAGAIGINTSVIRLFRLVRLVRLLKIFYSLQAFDSLFLLVKAVQASVKAMAYSFVMVLILQIVTGMFMCQTLQSFVLDDDKDLKVREDVYKYFGTFSRSMLTMFEISLANWVPSCRTLVEGVNQWWMVFYIIYRCMFCFALLKVISAVFITETNRVLASDDELYLMKQKREKEAYTVKLHAMFQRIDLDHDGFLTWDELQQLLKDKVSAEHLTTLGFQQHDFEKLFWLIDEGAGKISIEDFIAKVGKLKGVSKTIDTLTQLKLCHRIEMIIQEAFEKQGVIKKMDEIEDEEEHELFTGKAVI